METTHVRCTGVEAHDVPSGGSVYVYVLELRLRDGSVLRSRQRYSSWRAIHRAVRDVKGRTSPLPPFPDKNNWTRQTPTFLAARGKAIEQYIAAVLADPILAELPEVLALRSPAPPPLLSAQSTIGGSMTTMLDAAASSTMASPVAPAPSPASARAQRPQTAATASGVAATPPKATRPATTTPGTPLHGSSPAPRPTTALAPPVSSSSSSEALAWADLLLPLLALVLALVAGAALSAPALAGSSCILGLGAGRLYRLSVAAPAAEAELYSEASDLSSTTAVASPATLRTAAAPPAAQSAAGGGGGGGGGGGATTSGASRGGAGGSNLSREMAAFAAPTIAARAAASSAQAPDGVV